MQLSDACKTPPLHRPDRRSAKSSPLSTTATASPPRRRWGRPVTPSPRPPQPPSSQGAAGVSRKSQQRVRGSWSRKAESYRTRTLIDDESGVSKIKAARRVKPSKFEVWCALAFLQLQACNGFLGTVHIKHFWNCFRGLQG